MGLSFFLRDAVVTTSGLKRFTPGVDKRVHLLLSAVLWTAVGMWLLVRGGLWLRSADALWLIIPALLLGSAKSLLILDRTAEKEASSGFFVSTARPVSGRCIPSGPGCWSWR
jgi:hypothetical protein